MAFVSLETLGKAAQNTPQTPPSFIGKGRASRQKHLLSTRTIDSDDVDEFCQAAETFEVGLASAPECAGKTVALLFFQPSTRTRIGFEAATVALGSHSLGMEGMLASRANVLTAEVIA